MESSLPPTPHEAIGGGIGDASTPPHHLLRSPSTVSRIHAVETMSAAHDLVPADATDKPSNQFVSALLTDMYQVSVVNIQWTSALISYNTKSSMT